MLKDSVSLVGESGDLCKADLARNLFAMHTKFRRYMPTIYTAKTYLLYVHTVGTYNLIITVQNFELVIVKCVYVQPLANRYLLTIIIFLLKNMISDCRLYSYKFEFL